MKNLERFEKFVISQKGALIRGDKALIVRLNKPHKLWDLPGGRVDKKEDPKQAFCREIKEELGIAEFKHHGILYYDLWKTDSGVPIGGVINLIENNEDEVILSHEHTEYAWVEESEIKEYDYVWPWMAEAIKRGFQLKKLLGDK